MYEVDIKDVVRNYNLRKQEGFLFCLFEALSNALYCSIDNSHIQITVNLTRQYAANEINKDEDNFIQSFKIEDNGIGFTDENFKQFTQQMYKTNHAGGKGLGRVAFLKVFDDVKIESVFCEGEKIFRRQFSFGYETIKDNKSLINNEKKRTIVAFNGIKADFQEHTKKSIDYYEKELLQHFYIFLCYLKEKKKQFEIKLIDDSGKESERIINTAMLDKDQFEKEVFVIEDHSTLSEINSTVNFELWHIKTRNIDENKAFYVVDERSAGEIGNLDLPPGLLEDQSGFTYHYYAYLKSPFFSGYLNESRTKLSLPKETKKPDDKFVTEEKIQKILKEKISGFLQYEIGILNQKNESRVRNLLNDENNNKTANNRAFLYLLSDNKTKDALLNTIRYSDNPQKVLSKIKEFHEELQNETVKKIKIAVEKMKTVKTDIDFQKLENEIKECIQEVNAENLINLSSYILYRKYIVNLFNEGIKLCQKSKTQNEVFFHNILLPRKSNNSIDSNLWLLDDQFLYFEGTSEVAIEDIKINGNKIIRKLTKEEQKLLNEFNKKRLSNRIDLLFFPAEKKCIIIELKDPKAGLDENVFQMDKYVQLLANFVKPEFSIESFFTYLITDNFNKYDKPGNGYRKSYGIEGFVRNSADVKSYDNDNCIANQYSEVIRYTDIYRRANKRNQIFFEKINITDFSLR
ncbi:MAG: ATP-binding protein [Planctomycetaceae bacterium]|jgi:hypothetical protein|nr:ATP-binding protein [Planctomycetaceae bacterium]